jgi:hypothetical protein
MLSCDEHNILNSKFTLKNITTIENANINAQDQKITSKWYAINICHMRQHT